MENIGWLANRMMQLWCTGYLLIRRSRCCFKKERCCGVFPKWLHTSLRLRCRFLSENLLSASDAPSFNPEVKEGAKMSKSVSGCLCFCFWSGFGMLPSCLHFLTRSLDFSRGFHFSFISAIPLLLSEPHPISSLLISSTSRAYPALLTIFP